MLNIFFSCVYWPSVCLLKDSFAEYSVSWLCFFFFQYSEYIILLPSGLLGFCGDIC